MSHEPLPWAAILEAQPWPVSWSASCDWGNCDNLSICLRFSTEDDAGWVSVCIVHATDATSDELAPFVEFAARASRPEPLWAAAIIHTRVCTADHPIGATDLPCERAAAEIASRPEPKDATRCLCGGPWPCPDRDAPAYRMEAYTKHGPAAPAAPEGLRGALVLIANECVRPEPDALSRIQRLAHDALAAAQDTPDPLREAAKDATPECEGLRETCDVCGTPLVWTPGDEPGRGEWVATPKDTPDPLRSFTDIPAHDLDLIAAKVWPVARSHPASATCECVVAEVITRLLDLDYRILPPAAIEGRSHE